MIFVVDAGAARQALAGGLLHCPGESCGGVLRPWATARPRRVRVPGGGQADVRPDRARCAACGHTQVLLRAWCVPRRSCSADVIGAALLAKAHGLGHRRIAELVQVPAATVRDWLRGLARGAAGLTGQAVTVAAGADLLPDRSRGSELAGTLAALGAAARWFARSTLLCPPLPALTGVDYLGLLAARHRNELEQRLRIADPGQRLPALPPWHVVNLITAGHLLTTAPDG
ncbi:MAG TPA: hypothetical protein VGH27_09825 [Streptosporangiaceae bacterium]|jgi:hypothetical protein